MDSLASLMTEEQRTSIALDAKYLREKWIVAEWYKQFKIVLTDDKSKL